MIPVELELHNFLAYQEPGPLRFEGIHIACLVGPNGAGKSSLLDAMTWALWGKARTNSPDDLIHQGQDSMRVGLTFDQDGNRYRVDRQRKAGKRGSSLLDIQAWDPTTETWKQISEATMRATQAKIEQLLRLDYDTFVNSAFLLQGRADEFTTKTPAQRKQVLGNILGLSRWEIYESRAKERISGTKAEIQRLDGWLEEVERELQQRAHYESELSQSEEAALQAAQALQAAEKQWADLEQARNRLVDLQRQVDDHTRRIKAHEVEIQRTRHQRSELEPQADQTALQAARAQAQEELTMLEPLQVKLDELTAQQAALREETARLQGINQAMVPETEPLKARIATLEAATDPLCPTCGQPLTETHRASLLAELETELNGRRLQYRDNQARIQDTSAQTSTLSQELAGLSQQLNQRPALQRRVGELESAVQHAGEVAKQIDRMTESISRWERELKADQERRTALEKQADASEQELRASALTQSDLDKLRLEKRITDEKVGGARQKLATLEAYHKQRQERLEKRAALAEALGLYEDLREAFSKRGVPAMIIETVVPELERSANELLNHMTDGRLHVRIETQRETKAGDVREALDIVISDELGTRDYELYSGGEAFRINFAIRIALSRLLARRAGARLRSLFIDEGFGTQDTIGREHLLSAINSIQDDFDRILVITHIDELKDAFPARIEVQKTPQGSQYVLS